MISSVMALSALPVSAQDDEGFIPKMWKKFAVKNNPAQASSSAPVAPNQKKYQKTSNKPMPAMTKEEMIRQIKDTIGFDEGVLGNIPELKKRKDKDGKEFYAYLDGKQEIRLEDLDTNRLTKLLSNVQIQANAYQASMVAQQMEVVRESQRVSMVQQQMPRTPPPQPPRPPAPPPQPPRR